LAGESLSYHLTQVLGCKYSQEYSGMMQRTQVNKLKKYVQG